RSGNIAVVPHNAASKTEKGDDISELKVIKQKWRCRGTPRIPATVDKIIVKRLAQPQFPTRSEIITVREIGIKGAGAATLGVEKTSRDVYFIVPGDRSAIAYFCPDHRERQN